MRRRLRVAALALTTAVGIGDASALDWPGRAAAIAARASAAHDGEGRAEAIGDFIEVDAAEATPYLAVALADSEPPVRAVAASVAGIIGAEDLTQALIAALSDRDASVRAAAATALGNLRARDAADVVARALGDRDADVRRAAVEALAELGSADAVVAITEALTDRSRDVVVAALRALGELGQPGSTYAVLERVNDPNSEVALAAIDALVALRAPEAVGAFASLARGSRDDVALAALEGLGGLGDAAAVPVLVAEALSPRGYDGRLVAVDALTELGSADAIEPLAPLLLTHPLDVEPYFLSMGAAAWPALRSATSRTGGGDEALIDLWLRSGDPAALGAVSAMVDQESAAEFLRRSPTPDAFCSAVERPSLVVEPEQLVEWSEWAVAAGATSCLVELLTDRVDLDRESALGVVAALAPADPTLAADVLERHVDVPTVEWSEVGHAVMGTSGASSSRLLTRLLVADDPRLVREAAWALERDPALAESTAALVLDTPARAESLGLLTERVRSGERSALEHVRAAANRVDDPTLRAVAVRVASAGCALDGALVQTIFDRGGHWERRAAVDYAVRCGVSLRTADAAADPVVRAFALGDASGTELEEVAASEDAPAFLRLEAARRLLAAPPEDAAPLTTTLVRSGETALAAAGWLLASESFATPQERVLTAVAADAPIVRAALLLGVDPTTPGLGVLTRRETDAQVLRVLRGSTPYEAPVEIYATDVTTGEPRRDELVMAIRSTGAFVARRTDVAGRAVFDEDDVIAVFVGP